MLRLRLKRKTKKIIPVAVAVVLICSIIATLFLQKNVQAGAPTRGNALSRAYIDCNLITRDYNGAETITRLRLRIKKSGSRYAVGAWVSGGNNHNVKIYGDYENGSSNTWKTAGGNWIGRTMSAYHSSNYVDLVISLNIPAWYKYSYTQDVYGDSNLGSIQFGDVPGGDNKGILPTAASYAGYTDLQKTIHINLKDIGIKKNTTYNCYYDGSSAGTLWKNFYMVQEGYTISYNGNGATSGYVASQTTGKGWSVNLQQNGYSRTGHNFAGWWDGAHHNAGDSYSNTADVTMWAEWNAWQHTVAYNLNGGSGDSSSQTKTYGSTLYVHSAPSRYGYNFSTWNGSNGTNYSSGAYYGYDQNGGSVTLTAQWDPWRHTITYDGNGGSNVPGNQTKTTGYGLNISSQVPTRTGYKFTGWSASCGGTYQPDQSYTRDQNGGTVTMTATWKAQNYTIKYDANGGTGTMRDQTGQYTVALNLTKVGYARPGYTFKGWSTDKEAVTPTYTDGQSVMDLTAPLTTITLYAVWSKTDASFDTETLLHDDQMFTGDGSITGGSGTTYDKNHTDSDYAKVDESNNPGYFTRRK